MSDSPIRTYIVLSLLIITPLGFLSKFYSGPFQNWFNNYGVGIAYEIFWILIVFLFWSRKKSINTISLLVFAITSALEILQLWQFEILEKIRSYFFGRVLFGTTFSWWDFPHYAIGCVLGWLWVSGLIRYSESKSDYETS